MANILQVEIKNENERELVQEICTDGLNLFRILIGYLKPILPKISNKVEDILKEEEIDIVNPLDQQIMELDQSIRYDPNTSAQATQEEPSPITSEAIEASPVKPEKLEDNPLKSEE